MRLVMSGMAAVILSWVLGGLMSGCRFGNFYEESNNVNPLTGYYETEPQSLTFCATYSGTPPASCPAANVSQIPGTLSNLISQPVALQVLENSTGAAALFDPFTTISPVPWFPIFADTQTLLLNYERIDQPLKLWRDPQCLVQTSYDVRGMVKKNAPSIVRGKTTSGRLALAFQIKDQFVGSCGPTLIDLADCYESAPQCGESSIEANLDVHRQVRTYLEPYVENRALTLTTIQNVTALDYQVAYE